MTMARARRRRLAAYSAGAIVIALAASVGIAAVLIQNAGIGRSAASASDLRPAVPVCGFPGALVGKIVADAPRDQDTEPTGSRYRLPANDDLHIAGLYATDAGALVESQKDDGSRVFAPVIGADRGVVVDFDRDTREPHNNGSVAVAPDGTVYAIDSYEGRRDIAVFDARGTQTAAIAVPKSDVSEGHPLDLHGVTWVPDFDGEPALLVGERGTVTHIFREDGTYLGVSNSLPGAIIGASGNQVTAVEPISTDTVALRVIDVATGETIMSASYRPADGESGAGTPGLERPGAAVPAPHGDGFLIYEAGESLTWVDSIGVRRGIWLGDQHSSPSPVGDIVTHSGTYWMSVTIEGEESVLKLSADEMAAMLATPVSYKAQNGPAIAQLGIGVGVVSDAPFNHADWGEQLTVSLRFESGWGLLDGDSAADDVEFRYSIRGDPLSAQPITQPERAVDPEVGGGEVPLEVPSAVPGPYELSISMVDSASGETRSAACFRYSIGAESADLNLDDLAPGAGWGGPDPLRGVQLADRLGIGSFRIQLDVGTLIADPARTPAAARIDWSSLPGAADDATSVSDGFRQIRAASDYALAHDVAVIVQVGQNGDAERAAVDSGTWEGWAGEIVAAFARHAPGITLWSPWNEPNVSFDSGADFSTRVDIPFARAAHAANSDARVIAGNTLGFAEEWWTDAATTPLCQEVDALAVHPYTGWNRSWEEEGFAGAGAGYDSFRKAVGVECADLPVWDTESGWTSDGTLPYWTQGSKVARKLLWNRLDDVAGWTYFFSEGGWGENNLSWSLIQYESHIKPGALAFAAVSRTLAALGTPRLIDTGIPITHAAAFADAPGAIAAWTDEARVHAELTATAATATVTDQYGATREIEFTNGQADVVLTSNLQFFSTSDGSELHVAPAEPFGDDVLRGAHVRATSTAEGSDAQIVTSGSVNPYLPWRSGTAEGGVDENPALTVALDKPVTINRIAVASGSMECCETGLRSYTVSVRSEDGEWQQVASVEDQFWSRVRISEFDPISVTAVRVEVPWTTIRNTRVLDVNYSGLVGGLPPPFLGVQTASSEVVSIASISAWAPG
ncbi:galactose-binding domain-containing protein [Paramicrobacterium agarici]|uniref:galactose-binding domain-containing protein n=1 Tax=Paramicrobacterium agarici TaxID=630514 RepID=UPI001153A876|nr:hypothetical protein [Microbacterium agarici]TQO23443.1 hypothetical protein FB385_2293 [Microbacterium agarici]